MGFLNVIGTPQWIAPLPQNIVASVMQNFSIQCLAAFDELLDTAYVWTRNGMRLKDYGSESMRLVGAFIFFNHCSHITRELNSSNKGNR